MLDNGFLFSPPVVDQVRSLISVQREVVGAWHQSMESWCSRRADGINAALNLGTALAAAQTPQAAMGAWMGWYAGAVGRWTDDLQEQLRLGQATVEKMLPVVSVLSSAANAPSKSASGIDPVMRNSRPVLDLPDHGSWAIQPDRNQAA